MRKIVLAAASGLLALGMSLPSQAAVNLPVAAPGSAIAGYATPVVVLSQAGPATFVNLDPTANHDFVSVKKVDGKRLFESEVIGLGTAEIVFNGTIEPGDYDFLCTLHQQAMRGTATIV